MTSPRSLDERYLDFSANTGPVFAQYPQLEPLRLFLFRDLLVQRTVPSWIEHLKHWSRPLHTRARTRVTDDRADILIWLESQREVIVDALLPVYRQLVARGNNVVLMSFHGPPSLPGSALEFRYPARAAPPTWSRGAWEALCDVREALREKSLMRSFAYACAMTQALFDELNRVLEAVAPKVVLCASTQLIGGAAVLVASRSRGFTSLLLQHGILQPFYTPVIAERMLTWGPCSTEVLTSLGVPETRLITVGSPRHDSMRPSTNGHARANLLQALALPDKPTFVFFSNGNDLHRNGEAPRECARWLAAMAARYARDLNVVVRLHPNEDGSLYRGRSHLRVTKGNPDLATALDGCDWIGSLCSTTLYDALLYGKRAWQFSASHWPALADNWKQDLAARVASEPDLIAMVNEALSKPPPRCFDEKLIARVFANHGHATTAVAKVVEACLAGREAPTQSVPSAARQAILRDSVGTDG